MDIIRGSEWRRWDLHLHTPYTQKNDQYEGSTEQEKWDNFYQSINDYVGDGTDPMKSICAIGITDYLSIANYQKVKADNRLPNCVKLLLPNVEMRMTPVASSSPINIHFIFSPDIVDKLEESFFARLSFDFQGQSYLATKGSLISFGRAYAQDASLPEQEAYKKGLKQYIVNASILSNVFKNNKDLRDNTIIVVSNKSNDGVSGIRSHRYYLDGNVSQLAATRQEIYHFSDMIFSSNSNDIDYFLGESADNKEDVRFKYGALMPCIHGCDAHENSKIFEPDGGRYCWIKADPTFEGLKQVLYEPKERVRISPSQPETKLNYQTIERIEITDDNQFSPAPIYFNDRLTCIIGGKSTGKSLLLENLALAIDAQQTRLKNKDARLIKGVKVYWKDGTCSDDKAKIRKIVYIPQTYLNNLIEVKEVTTEIDRIIQDIIFQNEGTSKQFEALNTSIATHKQETTKLVVDFLQTISKRKIILETQKEVGDTDSVEREIKHLSGKLEVLSQSINVSEAEIQDYQKYSSEIDKINTHIKSLLVEKDVILSISSVLERKELGINKISYCIDRIKDAIAEILQNADSQWAIVKQELIQSIQKEIEHKQQILQGLEEKINFLKGKIEANDNLQQLTKQIATEQAKLSKIRSLEKELSDNSDIYNIQMESLATAFGKYKTFYDNYAKAINEEFAAPANGLEFSVRCILKKEQLSEKILDIFNNRTLSRTQENFNLNEISETEFLNSEKMKFLIEQIISSSSETVQLKSSYNPESALRDILDDWYNLNYIVKMDGDDISQMSPGKKALVLLKLLISMTESSCPIIIDQPEDDLDNRSIFAELTQFIKVKKVDRQIIIATHNANIVLGGDAELVIVANRDGDSSPNERYRFEYRGGAIESNSIILDANGNAKVGILNQKGIQQHICEILEGGEQAFDLRRNKYRFIK